MAECWAQPYAAKEDGPLTTTYKFGPLVDASLKTLFPDGGDALLGMSAILASQSLRPRFPEWLFAGKRIDTLASSAGGPGNELHAIGDGDAQFFGTTQHLSLPHSPSDIADFVRQVAHIFSLGDSPIVKVFSDPDVIAASAAAQTAMCVHGQSCSCIEQGSGGSACVGACEA